LLLIRERLQKMEVVIRLDRDDARVLHQLLKKMTEITWPPQCDVYDRISEKLVLAEEEAGLFKEEKPFLVST
jgi:hypothetical protein